MTFDAVVIGAGAAGLHCAAMAGQRGLRILLIDHAEKVAEKIRISGGGRCNFTNRDTAPSNYLSANPRFCRSALARYTPLDFLSLLGRHRIAWHEKHKGQLFADERSDLIIDMLLRECAEGGVTRWQPCSVHAVRHLDGFEIDTTAGTVRAHQLVVASGGLSIPKIGATDFGLRLARQFGHEIVPTRPALVPLSFDPPGWARFAALSGVSLPVRMASGTDRGATTFDEDLLFTHRGLSGPAALQISSYWTEGSALQIDLAPGHDVAAELLKGKSGSRQRVDAALGTWLPRRLAETWLGDNTELASRSLADCRDRDLREIGDNLNRWVVKPQGTEGYRKAEVMAGGVDTRELSSQSLESQRVPGLHFIGEVVDVTGWLGGYNFQWAWASAAACARALRAATLSTPT